MYGIRHVDGKNLSGVYQASALSHRQIVEPFWACRPHRDTSQCMSDHMPTHENQDNKDDYDDADDTAVTKAVTVSPRSDH
jgi:hypothetical protein